MNRSFLFGLLVGLAAGAVTGILLTPRSGRELRTEVRSRSRHAVDRLSKTAGSVVERFEGEFKLKPAM